MNKTRYNPGIAGALVGISVAMVTIGLTRLGLAQEKAPGMQERIGVYDSRAVAVAYAGSEFQAKKMKELMNQMKKAREAGDATAVSRLESEGRAWQARLHGQGFGTEPVDDLLSHIESDLPRIQQMAGVTSLVSKWDKPRLDQHAKAAQVDVTTPLVDAFHPNERQRKSAIEIQKKKPQKMKR